MGRTDNGTPWHRDGIHAVFRTLNRKENSESNESKETRRLYIHKAGGKLPSLPEKSAVQKRQREKNIKSG